MKALWREFSFAVALGLLAADLAGAECWEDVLYERDEIYLVMESGAAYRIIRGGVEVELWFPLSVVEVCEQAGYVDGQLMSYFEIRNADAAGVVWAVPVE
ncbi:MAG TPA: hypothetical protein VKH64_10200 [Candidatus Binatia bacterium]|nr:hypothetical protein [Candidatus Binatia bacterium]